MDAEIRRTIEAALDLYAGEGYPRPDDMEAARAWLANQPAAPSGEWQPVEYCRLLYDGPNAVRIYGDGIVTVEANYREYTVELPRNQRLCEQEPTP